jgi:hypothetical protein
MLQQGAIRPNDGFERFKPELKARDQLAPQRTVFISGLDAKVDANTLTGAFIPFGDITEVFFLVCCLFLCLSQALLLQVVLEEGQGHGFVEFEDPAVSNGRARRRIPELFFFFVSFFSFCFLPSPVGCGKCGAEHASVGDVWQDHLRESSSGKYARQKAGVVGEGG